MLEEKAMEIEFYEGTIADYQLIAVVEMQAPPRLGEFVHFSMKGVQEGYKIKSVEYDVYGYEVSENGVVTYVNKVSKIMCGCNQLYIK